MRGLILYRVIESKFGNMLVATAIQGSIVHAVLFGADASPDTLGKLHPGYGFVHSDKTCLMDLVLGYVDSGIDVGMASGVHNFHVEPHGTPFQKLVWHKLAKIPTGTTITYSELAELASKPLAARAVASAVASNPVGVLIPCHRVVPKSCGIGSYRWGTEMKQKLLEREQLHV